MSSLRLALKQSLQETGHLAPKEKKKKSSKTPRQRGRARQPGDPPRKRGRPPKHPRPTSESSVPASDNVNNDEDKRREEEEEEYSSENEFSYDSEMSHEEDDEEEEEVDDEGDDQEEEEHDEANDDGEGEGHHEGDHGEQNQNGDDYDSKKLEKARIRSEDTTDSDDERRKQRKLLKKQLKHSAANKIQSQWKNKKSKNKASESDGSMRTIREKDVSAIDPSTDSTTAEKGVEKNSPMKENPTANTERKKKRKSGTVPAPVLEVLEWSRSVSEKKCRKHIAKGMRVKVRFATKVKREGKVIKKKIFYGGRVSAASKEGSRIKIKYDDGTSEISQFPDKDVVVDDTANGQHLAIVQGAANKFIPPIFREEEMEVEEEAPLPNKDGSTVEDAPSNDQQVEKESKPAQAEEDKPKMTGEDTSEEKKADQVESKQPSEEIQEPRTTSSDAGTTKSRHPPESSEDGAEVSEPTPQQSEKPSAMPTDETPTEDETKPKKAPEVETSKVEKANDDVKETNDDSKQAEDPSSSRPSFTIRISNIKPKGRAAIPETTKQGRTSETPVYSSEEELHADTPVTERKVKSIKIKRKRPINDASPGSSPRAKKRKPDTEAGKEGDKKASAVDEKTVENSPKKGSKTISISLKRAESVEVPSIPALTQMMKKKFRASSPVPEGSNSPVRSTESPQPMSMDLEKDEEENTIVKPVSKQAPDGGMGFDSSEVEKSFNTVVGGSKGSAFGRKPQSSEAADESESLARSKVSADSLLRVGRKAAQEAKEKLNSKQDPAERNTGKKKKKRKRKEGEDSDGEDSDEDDRQWVQCDRCKKWRILPSRVQAASLPEQWYCNLNTYDPKHSDCSAPEQTVKQVSKEWRRARKRVKQQRLEQAALEAGQEDSKKDAGNKGRGVKSPVNSPKPTKVIISSRKGGDVDSKRASMIDDSLSSTPALEASPEPPKAKKRGRKPKKEKEESKLNESDKAPDTTLEVTPKKPGRKRGRPARNATVEAARAPGFEKKDDDNVEWVACEKCEKWRKLPPYMSADELPDTWYCTMNTWNPDAASCETPEDKADAHHQEVGVFGNIPQGHAGKYSYRSMIFGSGRKQNRPMSEKSRAAESLFQRPSADEGNPQTTVVYAKSSMFLPRTSNFYKTQVVEEKRTSIFDVLRDSELWTELQGVGQAMEVFSDGSIGSPQQKFLSYETLPEAMKETMREVVLQALGLYVLTGDDVVQEAQRVPWESLPNGLSFIRAYVNADVIINTLLALVKDGFVEMTCFKDMSKPMSEWIPRYRRVVRQKPKRNIETEEALKASKCMKIAKPWKKVDTSAEWITGGQ